MKPISVTVSPMSISGPLIGALPRTFSKPATNLASGIGTLKNASHLLERGARVADTPADAVCEVDLIMYSLSNEQAVEDVVFGAEGILSGIKEGQIAMD